MGKFFTMRYQGGAPAPAWTPESLSSLWGWWAFDEAGTLFQENVSPSTESEDDDVVGTWRSKEGNNLDIVFSTIGSDLKPILSSERGVQCVHNGSTGRTRGQITGLSAFNRNNFGGGLIVERTTCNWQPYLDFGTSQFFVSGGSNSAPRHFVRVNDGSGYSSTGRYFSSRRCVVTWRSDGSDVEVWVNGLPFAKGSGATSQVLDRIILGQFNGGSPAPIAYKEIVVCDAAPSDAEMASLNTYLRTRAGELGNGNGVAILGDSIGAQWGSETGFGWARRITNRDASEWRSYCVDGGYMFTGNIISAANLVTSMSGFTEKVAILYIGTNDIKSGARTGAQLWSDFEAYRATLQAAGILVVACTLPQLPANDTEAQAFNASLLASSDYDAIADLRADPALDDCTDSTYFEADFVHPKDAGHAAIGAVVQAAMASL